MIIETKHDRCFAQAAVDGKSHFERRGALTRSYARMIIDFRMPRRSAMRRRASISTTRTAARGRLPMLYETLRIHTLVVITPVPPRSES